MKFRPYDVMALMDLMSRDPSVGAVCGRTHPMGSGPLVWYQVFDYAIGHWLLKVSKIIKIINEIYEPCENFNTPKFMCLTKITWRTG